MSFLVPFVLFCRSVIPRREIVVLHSCLIQKVSPIPFTAAGSIRQTAWILCRSQTFLIDITLHYFASTIWSVNTMGPLGRVTTLGDFRKMNEGWRDKNILEFFIRDLISLSNLVASVGQWYLL